MFLFLSLNISPPQSAVPSKGTQPGPLPLSQPCCSSAHSPFCFCFPPLPLSLLEWQLDYSRQPYIQFCYCCWLKHFLIFSSLLFFSRNIITTLPLCTLQFEQAPLLCKALFEFLFLFLLPPHSKLLSLQPYIGIGIFVVFLAKPICIVSLSLSVPSLQFQSLFLSIDFSLFLSLLYLVFRKWSILFTISSLVIFVFYSIPFQLLIHFPYFSPFLFCSFPLYFPSLRAMFM